MQLLAGAQKTGGAQGTARGMHATRAPLRTCAALLAMSRYSTGEMPAGACMHTQVARGARMG